MPTVAWIYFKLNDARYRSCCGSALMFLCIVHPQAFTPASCPGVRSGPSFDVSLPSVCFGLGRSVAADHCGLYEAEPCVCLWQVPLGLLWKRRWHFITVRLRTQQPPDWEDAGTYTVLISSGFGTQLRRCDRSWNAWLWGSSISKPYRALMR